MGEQPESAMTHEVAQSKFGGLIESGALVEIELLDRETLLLGFPVFIGEDYVVLTRLYQQCWENGYRAIRLECIADVTEIDEDGSLSVSFIRRARFARGHANGLKLPFVATTFCDLLDVVCKHFPIAVMSGETSAGKSFDFAANVSSGDASSIHVRLFKENGFWQTKDQIVPVAEIHEVLFDSEYERTLVAMSQLDDA